MPFNWTRVEDGLIAASYPDSDEALAELRKAGVVRLINLHERSHSRERLKRHGMSEAHIPIVDFSAPSEADIAAALSAIEEARAAGEGVVVHCAAGIGRTGTVIACWLVHGGMPAHEAIARVRELRPGSVETVGQVAAVEQFARSLPRE